MRADGNHVRRIADKQIKHAVMESARLIARARDAICAGRASAEIRAVSADSASSGFRAKGKRRRAVISRNLCRWNSSIRQGRRAISTLLRERGSHLPSVNHKLFPSASHTRVESRVKDRDERRDT